MDASFKRVLARPSERDTVPGKRTEFNVTRFPFAAYLEDQEAPELTGVAACALGQRMARRWGVEFRRSITIATGGEHCDFRFIVSPDA